MAAENKLRVHHSWLETTSVIMQKEGNNLEVVGEDSWASLGLEGDPTSPF